MAWAATDEDPLKHIGGEFRLTMFGRLGLERGVLKTTAIRTYALADAAQAHTDAEAARYAGPVVLLP